MAVSLVKGQRIEIGLTNVGIGLGWDPNEGSGSEFDLDASAFMLDEKGKVINEGSFVYYGNLKSYDSSIESTGDDLTGGNSDGDDETLYVDLAKVDEKVKEIIFTVTIHEFAIRKQNFGQVRNSFIRIYNTLNEEEIAMYELEEDFSTETAIEFGRLYKRKDEWKFEAMGIGYNGGLELFCKKYGIEVE